MCVYSFFYSPLKIVSKKKRDHWSLHEITPILQGFEFSVKYIGGQNKFSALAYCFIHIPRTPNHVRWSTRFKVHLTQRSIRWMRQRALHVTLLWWSLDPKPNKASYTHTSILLSLNKKNCDTIFNRRWWFRCSAIQCPYEQLNTWIIKQYIIQICIMNWIVEQKYGVKTRSRAQHSFAVVVVMELCRSIWWLVPPI